MLIPGMVSATFRSLPASEVLSLCQKANLSSIEWSEGNHVRLGEDDQAKELAIRCNGEGVSVVALGSYYKLGMGMDFHPVLSLAKAIGAPLIRIWAGTKPSVAVDASEFSALAAEAEMVGKAAKEEGMTVAYEWHKNSLTDTNASAMKLLEATPSCDTLWQPTVALSPDERCDGLSHLGTRLRNLHVYYWDDEGKRRPLSEGKDLWQRYFATVSGDHHVLLEFVMDNSPERFLEDAKTLEGMVR